MGLTERLFEIIDSSGFANLRALLPLDKGGEEATGMKWRYVPIMTLVQSKSVHIHPGNTL